MKKLFLGLCCLLLARAANAQIAPARPPITGIALLRVFSANLHDSDKFYRSTLGLEHGKAGCKLSTTPCYSVNDHQLIQLVQVTAAAPDNMLEGIAFSTPDVAQMRRFLLAHNIQVGEVAKTVDGVEEIALRDPEGNKIGFRQSPSGTFFTAAQHQISTRLIHAGFVVSDRATMDRFYKDILGFHVYWHGGMSDAETNWVDMQVPEGSEWLEYMLRVPPNADKHTRGVMNHFALGVPRVRDAEKRIVSGGINLPETPKVGRDGKWQLNLYDPDDTRVEMMEFVPVEKPCCAEYTGPHPKP